MSTIETIESKRHPKCFVATWELVWNQKNKYEWSIQVVRWQKRVKVFYMQYQNGELKDFEKQDIISAVQSFRTGKS